MQAAIKLSMNTSRDSKFSPFDLAAWSSGEWSRLPDEPLGYIQQDTRSLMPGGVYVALRGESFDGHDFIVQAQERGASAAIVDHQWKGARDSAIPCLMVNDTRRGLRDLAVGYRKTWSANVLGITGSVGKTTAKDFASDLFKTIGITSATQGNYNNHIGVPLSMLAARADMDFGIFEMGMNRPGEIEPLARLVEASAAIMTPVGLAHKEAFETEQDIAIEKSQLLRQLPEDGFCVLNRDLAWFDLLREASPGRVITVSLDRACEADWQAVWNVGELIFLHQGVEYFRCHPYWKAPFIVRTALQSLAAAHEWGANPEDLRIALECFSPSGRRWNQQEFEGIVYFDDSYNANPLSMIAALDAFQNEGIPGDSWVVLGEMKELGDISEEEHRKLGQEVAKRSLNCIALGDAGEWIHSGCKEKASDGECLHATDVDAANEFLRDKIKFGDGVLFKASRGIQLERVIQKWITKGEG